jgi:hypothetical protein
MCATAKGACSAVRRRFRKCGAVSGLALAGLAVGLASAVLAVRGRLPFVFAVATHFAKVGQALGLGEEKS